MKVKLCGFTDEISVRTAVENRCDFLGFIFVEKSLRHIKVEEAVRLGTLVPNMIKKVAVVANSDFNFLTEIAQKFSPNYFQFHGDEDVEYLKKSRQKFPQVKIIKAFKIKEREDFKRVENFVDYCDFLLFDGENPGSGEKFDWQILKNFSTKKEWFLSGGINVNNVGKALEITGAKMIDISSGIEEEKGKKSPKLITEFMNKINSLC